MTDVAEKPVTFLRRSDGAVFQLVGSHTSTAVLGKQVKVWPNCCGCLSVRAVLQEKG